MLFYYFLKIEHFQICDEHEVIQVFKYSIFMKIFLI